MCRYIFDLKGQWLTNKQKQVISRFSEKNKRTCKTKISTRFNPRRCVLIVTEHDCKDGAYYNDFFKFGILHLSDGLGEILEPPEPPRK